MATRSDQVVALPFSSNRHGGSLQKASSTTRAELRLSSPEGDQHPKAPALEGLNPALSPPQAMNERCSPQLGAFSPGLSSHASPFIYQDRSLHPLGHVFRPGQESGEGAGYSTWLAQVPTNQNACRHSDVLCPAGTHPLFMDQRECEGLGEGPG